MIITLGSADYVRAFRRKDYCCQLAADLKHELAMLRNSVVKNYQDTKTAQWRYQLYSREFNALGSVTNIYCRQLNDVNAAITAMIHVENFLRGFNKEDAS